ncbi:MAG: SCP2 sterol-binding domain-containing protein [Chloroflexota bacterium]
MYSVFQELFDQIQATDHLATDNLIKSGLVIRFECRQPRAEVSFDASRAPLKIEYGPSQIQPQITVILAADTLHCILLGDLGIRNSLGRGLLELKGPIWKAMSLGDLFRQTQDIYPVVLEKHNLSTSCPELK